MLKFLTHKLRTHSINEDNNYTEKADEDHDSGTESDEEIDDPDLPSVVMSVERMSSVSPADTGCSMESPAPTDDQQHDPHSSEEELEVINSNKPPHHHNHHHHHPLHQHSSHAPNRPLRATSAVCLPEKRKWSQVGGDTSSESTMTMTTTQVATPLFSSSRATNKYTPENEENMSHYGNLSPSSSCSPCHHNKYYNNSGEDGIRDGIHIAEHSGSSDEEVHHLLASMATPVQFRTSPPLEAVKPGKKPTSTTTTTAPIPITIPIATTTAHGTTVPPTTLLNMVRSLSPPPSKLLHYEMSPRKRSKHARHSHTTVHQQRPYLDFEKMQNLKARSVRTWRHSGDHGGELSVFCW